MIKSHRCPYCNYVGQVFLPMNPNKTTILCPKCNVENDVGYFYRQYKTLEEYEREEYKRLKKKFEGS
ncbi:hypothetical protein [Bacillus phage vB_BanS-Thrax4]|nr:hypothetical protein [Bacillus phage vB_BanS-Thrax4]